MISWTRCSKALQVEAIDLNSLEFLRFCINGGVATIVHFLILVFGIEALQIPSAGLANALASLFGITTSFFGNRWFVFPKTGSSILTEFAKFAGLYLFIAILHGLILFAWSDTYGFDYRLGFVLATGLQVILSYFGNKLLVFK